MIYNNVQKWVGTCMKSYDFVLSIFKRPLVNKYVFFVNIVFRVLVQWKFDFRPYGRSREKKESLR